MTGLIGFLVIYGSVSLYLDKVAGRSGPDVQNIKVPIAEISAQQLCTYASFLDPGFKGTLHGAYVVASTGSEPIFFLHFVLPDGTMSSRYYRLSDIQLVGVENGMMQFQVKRIQNKDNRT